MSDLGRFTSNKPTLYLLDYDDFNQLIESRQLRVESNNVFADKRVKENNNTSILIPYQNNDR